MATRPKGAKPMRLSRICGVFFPAVLSVVTLSAKPADTTKLRQQVIVTEKAFAQTMSDRDFAGFSSFISNEAVFFSGEKPLHGKQEVIDWWKRYYENPEAPFSWEPESVEVLDSGELALSTGPVYDPKGKLVGTFTSIWRLEAHGNWRIVFDKGNPVCDNP
jgi:ketosteroid isomerase-like protein